MIGMIGMIALLLAREWGWGTYHCLLQCPVGLGSPHGTL